MKPASLLAFALTSLAAPVVGAQTRAVNNAPVVIESNGRPQEVRVEWRGPVACLTPCTLHLQPGFHTVWTGGRGLRAAELPLEVSPEGMRVRVRAASRGRLVGGIILTSLGGSTLLVMGTLSLLALSGPSGDESNQFMGALLGGMTLLIGAPSLIGGIAMLSGTGTGIESVTPVAPPAPQWTLGAAPVRGGAMAGVTVTF